MSNLADPLNKSVSKDKLYIHDRIWGIRKLELSIN